MIELIFGALETPKNPLIIEPEPIVIEEPKQEEPVVTWRDNPQGCNEDIEYIAAEAPYYCIPKRIVERTALAKTPVKTAVNSSQASSGWYDWGWCTYYVSTRRPVGQWHDARTWPSMARAEGYYVGPNPVVGAIGQRANHVVYVESVNGDTVTVSEMNYEGFGVVSSRTVPTSLFTYIY